VSGDLTLSNKIRGESANKTKQACAKFYGVGLLQLVKFVLFCFQVLINNIIFIQLI